MNDLPALAEAPSYAALQASITENGWGSPITEQLILDCLRELGAY